MLGKALVFLLVSPTNVLATDIDCSAWDCDCQGFQDYFGAAHIAGNYAKGYGCAAGANVTWYKQNKCVLECTKNQTACEPSTHQHLGCNVDCTLFGCTCQGFADYYGSHYKKKYGCAGAQEQKWHKIELCDQECKVNKTGCDPTPGQHPGCGIDCNEFGCTCQGYVDYYGVDFTKRFQGCATDEAQAWALAEDCDAQCKTNHTGCNSSSSHPHDGCALDCTPFGCTCQGFADYYGTKSGKSFGCATSTEAQLWWKAQPCEGKGIPPVTPSVKPGIRRGGCTCDLDTSAGLHEAACMEFWHGFKANYNVPEKCLSSSCGLIVDVHGFSMGSKAEDANTNMRALGAEQGYIVVQPHAPGNNWNVDAHGTGCTGMTTTNGSRHKQTCWQAPFDAEPVGDVAIHNFVQAVLEVPEWNIDRNRVHLMGFSEGGWMTGRMICNYPDLYASFVMLAGGSNADPFECIQPGAVQPPVLVNQGFNDYSSVWQYFNNDLQSLKQKWSLGDGEVIDGDATCSGEGNFDCAMFNCTCQGFADWYNVKLGSKSLGCAGKLKHPKKWWKKNDCSHTARPDAVKTGCEGCFTRTRYESPSKVPLEVLEYSYVADYFLKGHCFPGSDDIKSGLLPQIAGPFGCPGKTERDAGAEAAYVIGEEALKWFMAHEKHTDDIVI